VLAVPAAYHFTAPFVFVAVVAVFVPQAGLFSRMICTPPGQALGEMSYSIYMVHVFLLQLISNVVSALGIVLRLPVKIVVSQGGDLKELVGMTRWQGDIGLLVYVAAVIGFAMFTFRYIEVPTRRWSRMMVRRSFNTQVREEVVLPRAS